METIIELYDHEPIRNVLAPSVLQPARVIYIGGNLLEEPHRQQSLLHFFQMKCKQTEVLFFTVDGFDYDAIRQMLTEVFYRYPDAVIDITGGSSMMLFAVGMFCKEHPVPVFSYHGKKNRLFDVFCCPQARTMPCDPKFTVNEVLSLAGGSFLRYGHISKKDLTDTVLQHVEQVFSVFLAHPHRFNRLIQYFQAVCSHQTDANALSVRAPMSIRVSGGKTISWDGEMMTRLAEFGLLQDVHASGGRVQFRFESPIVRQCLNDIGVWLEMYVYKQAVESGLFDDVQISVVVDWDGDINESINTINEIDLILTRGVSSLFVSCKSGVPSTMALNEINTLTEWFGGMFSKGVIVTMCELSTVSPATYRRAIDMGLCVIQKEDMEAGKIGELLAAAAPAGTLLCPAE